MPTDKHRILDWPLVAYCRLRTTNARRRLKYEGLRGVLAACQREITGRCWRTLLDRYRRLSGEQSLFPCPHKPLPSPAPRLEARRHATRRTGTTEIRRALATARRDLLSCEELANLRARITADLEGKRSRLPPLPRRRLPRPRPKSSPTLPAAAFTLYRDTLAVLAMETKTVHDLAGSISRMPLFTDGAHPLVFQCLLAAGQQLFADHGNGAIRPFTVMVQAVQHIYGPITAVHLVAQMELILGLRRPRLAIYDHAFHFAGGGQRYVAEIAHALQQRFEVTYIVNQTISLDQCREWYGLDLRGCALKVIPIPPAIQEHTGLIDEGRGRFRRHNIFDVIGLESLNYDIFINANMLTKVTPLALRSVFVCHFPNLEKDRFFQVHKYEHLVANSGYTISWIKKRWGLTPNHLLYPPVEMYHPHASATAKEKIILSVARFDLDGSKKQLELVRAFADLVQAWATEMAGWRLVLAGGSLAANSYLQAVRDAAQESGCPIEFRVNAAWDEIRDLYRRAAIFWHACGLGESRPELVEHFGMTTVEAMQNYCVPVVINGGGQREIVEEGKQGFLFSSLDGLRDKTLRLIRHDDLRRTMAANAYERSHRFNRHTFLSQVDQLFDAIEADLANVTPASPTAVVSPKH